MYKRNQLLLIVIEFHGRPFAGRKSSASAVWSGQVNTAVKDKKFRVLTLDPQMKEN